MDINWMAVWGFVSCIFFLFGTSLSLRTLGSWENKKIEKIAERRGTSIFYLISGWGFGAISFLMSHHVF